MSTQGHSATFAWTAEHDRQLHAMQVAELFRFMPFATGSAFIGAGLTLGVLIDTGAGSAGFYWFALFTMVTLYRGLLIISRERVPDTAPETWAQLAIIGNVAAGILWGILGSVLFPTSPSYRELFIVMVISCYVGGSVTTYAPVKWAHPALTLPAVLPVVFYLTYVRQGIHIYSALMAFVFLITVTGIGLQQHRRISQRLRLIIENRELLKRLAAANSRLLRENSDLSHRAAVRLKTAHKAQDRADLLARHFENTPLAMLECDEHFNLLAWNDAAGKLLGARLPDLAGQPILPRLFEGERGKEQAALITQFASNFRPLSMKAHFLDLDQAPHDGMFHVTPIPGRPGLPGRVALVIAPDPGNGHWREAA